MLKPLPGFPSSGAFTTKAQVDHYLAGDKVVCLLCGRAYRSVGHHIVRAHDMTVEQYQIRYGLPRSRGVVGRDSAAGWSASMKRRHGAGQMAGAVERMAEAARGKGPLPPYARREIADLGRRSRGWERPLGDEHFARIINRVRDGMTITEACRGRDVPRWTSLHAYLDSNPGRKAAFNAMWDELPFPAQARSKKLGARFRAEVARLRGDSLTYEMISGILGVSEEVCRRTDKGVSRRKGC